MLLRKQSVEAIQHWQSSFFWWSSCIRGDCNYIWLKAFLHHNPALHFSYVCLTCSELYFLHMVFPTRDPAVTGHFPRSVAGLQSVPEPLWELKEDTAVTNDERLQSTVVLMGISQHKQVCDTHEFLLGLHTGSNWKKWEGSVPPHCSPESFARCKRLFLLFVFLLLGCQITFQNIWAKIATWHEETAVELRWGQTKCWLNLGRWRARCLTLTPTLTFGRHPGCWQEQRRLIGHGLRSTVMNKGPFKKETAHPNLTHTVSTLFQTR